MASSVSKRSGRNFEFATHGCLEDYLPSSRAELGRCAVMQRAIDAARPILSRRDARKLPEFPGQMRLIGIAGGRSDVAKTVSASRSHASQRGVEASYAVVMLRIEPDG